ncbi:VWA domain-containing protein [Aquitalea sp. LB_tupeE]|uniref:VWA domain-containing protein n=1 Tax=Aquitalea sp. LB_tupeE TaxID=2748078 RepID=UPI0015BDF6F6|nr:VWA domain-containing protein [Aquitalea sp. LB_tupeE]NWK79561.1 VWA domain-containing protein [Aquitalea sp. LB_tupeE]
MFALLSNAFKSGLGAVAAALPMGIKAIKYFVDSTLRQQVIPVSGSVLYSDLWLAVEHSGIYVGDGLIANIVVDGVAQSTVMHSTASSFVSKSKLGRKIYVSCDRHGAVGDLDVSQGANFHIGEQAFYGLVIKNCHQFSTKCVNYAQSGVKPVPLVDQVLNGVFSSTWEPTISLLKSTAQKKLGATKWRLWDWDGDIRNNPPSEPDWSANEEYFRHQVLNADSTARMREESDATRAYLAEIDDEDIPSDIKIKLRSFNKNLLDIVQKYEEVKGFLALCPNARFSYADLQQCGKDLNALADLMQNNQSIKTLVHKMGRAFITEEMKRKTRIPEASRDEVHGTHRSADLQRLLPAELVNLEDESLEMLFYARLLEQNLQTYELSGVTYLDGETTEAKEKRTGPVIACLDTSASMSGEPLLKAKALLLAIANILRQESRSLHVLMFGSAGEMREFSMEDGSDHAGLLRFLSQGFDGGTDFETPLRRSLELISSEENYLKADVLMISDGDCQLGDDFASLLAKEKGKLGCLVYSVLCAGQRVSDNFSDEVVVL